MLDALVDFSHTRLSWRRPVTDYAKVRWLLSAVMRNRYEFINPRVLEREYLDMGCGPNVHMHTINLDWEWHPKIDVVWDVTKSLPVADGSLKGIFTEHMLEHLPLQETYKVLERCRRALQPGGTIRVVVPNLSVYVDGYRERKALPYADTDAIFDGECYTPAMSVNRIMRLHGHQFIYDFETMRALLERSGFHEIREETFQRGRDPQLLLDTPMRAVESLYVEAST